MRKKHATYSWLLENLSNVVLHPFSDVVSNPVNNVVCS